MKPLSRITALLILVGLAITACGGQATTAAPAPTEAQPPTEAPAAIAPAPTEAPPPTEAPAEPKILRVRQQTDLVNADPPFNPGMMDTVVATTVGEGLVTFKPGTWEIVNVLAESISPSEDGQRIDFKLREGVQFHGGYGELTADDVKFSYERYLDPNLSSPYAGDWAALDHVEVTGKYTGSIVLNDPFVPLWSATLPIFSGLIVSKAALDDMGLEAYATHPIGTGPYYFAEWKPNDRVILKRFEDYWGERPNWDEIDLLPIPDDSAAEIALEAGELDFSTVSVDSVERFRADDQYTVGEIPTLAYSGILMNVQHPKLQDVNVRQAIRYAVDVSSVLAAEYGGEDRRRCTLLSSGQIGYWAGAPCYDRDVDQATGFMAQAGLESLDLTLTILDSEHTRAIAEIVQANLGEIGVNVEIVPQDVGAYWEGGFGEKGLQERELTLIEWSTTNPDPYWLTVWFTCDQVMQYNWMYWCNEEFDRLHQTAVAETVEARRSELYVEMQKIWDEDVHTAWLARPVEYFVSRAGVEASLTPNALPILWDFRSK